MADDPSLDVSSAPVIQPGRLRRVRDIVEVFTKHGLGSLMNEWGLSQLVDLPRQWAGYPRAEAPSRAERVRLALEELGTTFIKMGQILSTRLDLIPAEYIQQLSRLQDSVPPCPTRDLERLIERELGAPSQQLFLNFEPTPLAAASIGQVHQATLRDGTPVVVKIQRPGVAETVGEDLALLSDLVRLLKNRSSLMSRYDVEGWLDEFAFSLRDELDYTLEARNADQFRHDFRHERHLRIPKVYWSLTSRHVLTMERLNGVKINDFAALDAQGVDRGRLAETCARMVITMLLEHGFYHADPHPGNFFVMPDGVIGLLDYGMVGRLDGRLRARLLTIGLAISRQDAERLADELLDMGVAPAPVSRSALKRDLDHLMRIYIHRELGDIPVAQLFRDIMQTSARHEMQLPAELALLVKVLMMHEGLGKSLCPTFKLAEFAQPYLIRYFVRSRSPESVLRTLEDSAGAVGDVLVDLPRRLRVLLRLLERGDFKVHAHVNVLEDLPREVRSAASRLSMAVLTAGLIIGFSVLALASASSRMSDLGGWILGGLVALVFVAGVGFLVSLWNTRP